MFAKVDKGAAQLSLSYKSYFLKVTSTHTKADAPAAPPEHTHVRNDACVHVRSARGEQKHAHSAWSNPADPCVAAGLAKGALDNWYRQSTRRRKAGCHPRVTLID